MASYQGFVQRWGRHVTQCEGWWLLAGASGSTGQTGASGQTGLTGGLRLWRSTETSRVRRLLTWQTGARALH